MLISTIYQEEEADACIQLDERQIEMADLAILVVTLVLVAYILK